MTPRKHSPQKKLQGGTVPPSSEKSLLNTFHPRGGGQFPPKKKNPSLNLCPANGWQKWSEYISAGHVPRVVADILQVHAHSNGKNRQNTLERGMYME